MVHLEALKGCFVTWACALLLVVAAPQGADGRPNFVIFMADDLGYGDIGFMGNKDVETPNIDNLARQSVFIPNFYVSPVCTPTRASLLTGRYFLRTGVWGVHGGRDFLNLDESTFGTVLSKAGYSTAMFGKWHNGKTEGYFPWQRGFNEACMTELYNYYDNRAVCNGNVRRTSGWVQENIAGMAREFISRKASEGQDFLLYIPFMSPHLGRFKGSGGGEYWPAKKHLVDKYKGKGLSDGLSHLYAMIEMMDSTVGSILDQLDNQGLGDNTVVMFFSDNGSTGKEKMNDWHRRNHHGFKGEKGQVAENGIRSPLFVRWRGSFPAGSVAKTQLASVQDIFPTLVSLAGAGDSSKPLDGVNLAPILRNPNEDQGFSSRTLYHTIMAPEWTREGGRYTLLPNLGTDKSGLTLGRAGRWALREGPWKYVNDQGEYLYNLLSDPGEQHPIRDAATIERLRKKMAKWWQGMLDDGGSFTTPSFYIGYPGSSSSVVIAPAAAEMSGSWNLGTHHAEGYVGPGQYLKYRVIVESAGGYNIKLRSWGDFWGELEFIVSCGESRSSTKGWLQSNGDVGHIHFQQSGSYCVLKMSVTSEWGNLKFSQIRFENSGGPAGYDNVVRSIHSG